MRVFTRLNTGFVLALLLLSGGPKHLFANSKETVSSRISGGTPYLIVYEDDDQETNLDPGVYVRGGERGEWELAVPGRVYAPSEGGFSLQLDLGAQTKRAEAVTIIDGFATVFSTQSRPKAKKSYAIFGDNGYAAWDPITQRDIAIPKVKSLEDISLISKTTPDHEFVLVSLKSKTPLGTGLTFAVIFANKQNKNKIELHAKPLLLDWHYWEDNDLSDLYLKSQHPPGFFSLNLLAQYAQTKPADPPRVIEWRKRLKEALKADAPIENFNDTFPYFVLETGELEISNLPSVSFTSNYLEGSVVFDPISGRHGVYSETDDISYSDIRDKQPLLHGVVAVDKEGGVEVEELSCSAVENDELTLLRLEDGTIYAIAQVRRKHSAIRIEPTHNRYAGKHPTLVSWFGVDETPYIIASWKFEEGELTSAYELDDSSGALRIKSAITLGEDYFDADHLHHRYQEVGDSENPQYGFDALTKAKTKEQYRQKAKDDTPLIELEKSLTKRELVWFYPLPTQHTELSPRIAYRNYASFDGIDNPTGFYLIEDTRVYDSDPDEKDKRIFAGQLLAADRERETSDEWIIDRAEFSFRENTLVAQAIRISYDLDDDSDPEQRIIALAFHTLKTGGPANIVSFVSELPEKYENFILVAPPKPTKKRDLNDNEPILCAFLTHKEGTFLHTLTIKGITQDGIRTRSHDPLKVSNDPLSKSELASRMRYLGGVPHFVMTAHLADNDREFYVVNPLTRSKLFPNRNPRHPVRFDDVEEGEEENPFSIDDTWRILGVQSNRLRKYTKRVGKADEYDLDVFPDFSRLLNEQANPKKKAKHVILVVPDDLDDYAELYPFAAFVRQSGENRHWSYQNPALSLYLLDSDSTDQQEVLANLRAMTDMNRSQTRRAFFYSTLDTLIEIERPPATDEVAHFLNEPKLSQGPMGEGQGEADTDDDEDDDDYYDEEEDEFDESDLDEEDNNQQSDSDDEGEQDKKPQPRRTTPRSGEFFPHILYWLATEGNQTALKDFTPKQHHSVPVLLVGTQDELDKLKEQAASENNRRLLEDFEVINLSQSTQQVRRSLLERIFTSPEFRELNYQIDVSDIERDRQTHIAQEEAISILCTHLVNRIDSLSAEYKQPIFTSFMRVISVMNQELAKDPRLRQAGIINRSTIETILSKVFPVPLHLDLLAPEDPIRRLADPEFPLNWQQNGYDGPILLKRHVIRTILSQLRNDGIRNIPSSMLVYGDSGAGKTFLVKTLFQTLGLTPYEFSESKSTQPEAQSFLLEMTKIEYSGTAGTAMMTLQQASDHLDNFLASANGSRGFVCLDDLHTASPQVREFFIKKIRSLFENQFYKVKGRLIPTRNISLIVTLNPTDKDKLIEEYTTDKENGPTDLEVILATLNEGMDMNVEKSLLRRFGLVLNLDRFPTSAKAPALIRTTTKAASVVFNNPGRYVLVTPQVVHGLVDRFPDMNARSFLSAGANNLVAVNGNLDQRTHIIVPNPEYEDRIARGGEYIPQSKFDREEDFDASGSNGEADIERYIRAAVQKLPIDGSPQGQLHFLGFLLNNFRIKAFELLIRALTEDSRYFQNDDFQKLIQIPLAEAVHDHLSGLPLFPLPWLRIDFSELSTGEQLSRLAYHTAFQQMLRRQTGLDLPVPDIGTPPRRNVLATLVNGGIFREVTTRQHILRDLITNVSPLLGEVLRAWMYSPREGNLPEVRDWLSKVPSTQIAVTRLERLMVESVTRKFSDHVMTYARSILAKNVSRNSPKKPVMTQYDLFRLLCLAYDKAMGQLPWARITRFFAEVTRAATGSLSLGSLPGVQLLLFESKNSPLIASDASYVRQLARNLPGYDEENANGESSRRERFHENCAALLALPEEEGSH